MPQTSGYARVSTDGQNLDAQLDALKAAVARRVFADRISGSLRKRPELDKLLDQLRDGDVVVVTKYDRLARSLKDLLEVVEIIKSKGAGFRSLAEGIDTTTPVGWPSSMSSPPLRRSSGSGSRSGLGEDWRPCADGAG